MIVFIEKQRIFSGVLCGISVFAAAAVLQTALQLSAAPVPAFLPAKNGAVTWIVDAGHGGEDGGAVSPDGVEESGLNLEIALRLHDLLRFSGQQTQLTRSGEEGLHTEGDSIRTRKASDIRNRVSAVNSAENPVLLSIHQNSLPSSPVTHGAQAFQNRQEGSEVLTYLVQDSLNQTINCGNEKHFRMISDTIYLMKHVTAPAVLVECGFLSNPEETVLLQTAGYQKKLAAAIAAGCLRCISGEEAP